MRNFARYGMAAAVATVLTGASATTSDAATKLRLAGQHPIEHNATKVLKETIKKIEDAGVDIKIKLFPAGQLGNGEQVFGDVAQGVIDIGHTFIYSHNDPVLEINSLPYLVGNYEEMRKVYSPGSNFYRVYEERLANQGLKLLGVFAEGLIGVGAAKKPTNPTTVGDKGLNIRVWFAWIPTLLLTTFVPSLSLGLPELIMGR